MKFNPSAVLLPIRIFQGLFAVLVIALSAFIANWYNTTTVVSSPGQINFLLFIGVFSLFSIAALEILPRVFPRLGANPYLAIGFEFTNVLFWFAGWLALAVFLSKLLFCRGTVCHVAQADVAFGALAWMSWTGSAGILAATVFKAGFRKPSGVEVPVASLPGGKGSGGGAPAAVEKDAS